MAKVLRILVILLLLLSAVALWFGVKLFNKREILKGQAQVLVDSVMRLAGTIEAEQKEDLTAKDAPKMDARITREQLTQYYAIDKTGQKTTTGPGTMNATLSDLYGKAKIQMNWLNDTRDTLKSTRENLSQTEKKAKDFETQTITLKKTVAEDDGKIGTLTQDVKDKTDKIGQIEEEKGNLEGTIKDQKDQIAQLGDQKTDLQDQVKQLKRIIEEVRQQQQPQGGTNAVSGVVAPGLKGQVVLVDTNWNFVVLSMANKVQLYPAVELHVQRDAKLVAKVRVAEVKPQYRLAIANILPDWQQTPIQVGDYVFF